MPRCYGALLFAHHGAFSGCPSTLLACASMILWTAPATHSPPVSVMRGVPYTLVYLMLLYARQGKENMKKKLDKPVS